MFVVLSLYRDCVCADMSFHGNLGAVIINDGPLDQDFDTLKLQDTPAQQSVTAPPVSVAWTDPLKHNHVFLTASCSSDCTQHILLDALGASHVHA